MRIRALIIKREREIRILGCVYARLNLFLKKYELTKHFNLNRVFADAYTRVNFLEGNGIEKKKKKKNKANRPTMRPQRFALCVLRYAMVVAAEAAVAEVAVAAVMVVAAVVVLLVIEESHGMILCLKKVRFSHLLKRRVGVTELRTDRPS